MDKDAKRGYCMNNQATTEETLQTRAARISRKATSIALKCSVSEELLVELEKAIDMLDLEADESLSQRGPAKPQSVHINSSECAEHITNANISFKVPQAIKGPKEKRAKGALEKKGTKKKKTGAKKTNTGTKKGNAALLLIFVSQNFIDSIVCVDYIFINSRYRKQSYSKYSCRRRSSTVYLSHIFLLYLIAFM
jgi:hypothetical protein